MEKLKIIKLNLKLRFKFLQHTSEVFNIPYYISGDKLDHMMYKLFITDGGGIKIHIGSSKPIYILKTIGNRFISYSHTRDGGVLLKEGSIYELLGDGYEFDLYTLLTSNIYHNPTGKSEQVLYEQIFKEDRIIFHSEFEGIELPKGKVLIYVNEEHLQCMTIEEVETVTY